MNPFRRRPRLLTAVGVVVTLAVGALAVLAFVPLRQPDPPAVAEARLMFTGPDGSGPASGGDLATQAALVRSWSVIGSAAHRRGEASEGLDAIQARLTVAPDPAAPHSFLIVRYAHPDPDEARRTLNSVIQTYLELREQVVQGNWYRARQDAEKDLVDAEQRLGILRRRAAAYRRDEARAGTVEAAAQKLAALAVRRAEVGAALAWVERAAGDPATKPAAALKVAEWAAKTGYDRLPAEVRGKAELVAAYTAALKAELGEIEATRKALDDLLQNERRAEAEGDEASQFRAEIDRAERKAAAARADLDRLGSDPNRGHFKVVVFDPPRIVR